jgi:ketosteroid isomerase-like protein
MARTLPGLFLPVLMIAAACGHAADGAAAGGRSDTAQQAAAAAAARDTAQMRQAVLRLEAELFQSYVRGDSMPAARLLAEDYMGFTADGMRETKAQALANLHRDSTAATAIAVDSIHIDSTTARVYGDAVVVQASGTFQAHDRRQSASVGFRNTDVFVWRDGRWQIVATHLSKVLEPKGRSHAP